MEKIKRFIQVMPTFSAALEANMTYDEVLEATIEILFNGVIGEQIFARNWMSLRKEALVHNPQGGFGIE